MKTSIYKQKILNLLEKKHLLSIADIHAQLSDADYSTIYRNIEKLVSEDQIRKIVFDKGNVKYEIAKESGNHDHFLCTDCGDVEKIHVPASKLSLSSKYVVSDLVVRGLCEDCNQKI